ncbi:MULTISPECIES: hypothetical protein [unclassified Sphingomonas]|uniref:hypothetical protein n=1 Tax=unclassified Sphingomonas TaxID=196159 RepID=UPI0006F25C35|nr:MULTISPECIES: hypothetical protein [unclassified Sphingomonas]KQX19254.1 hypothetical protein ASD17_11930 [Sphingomonas sp. Root1294]KQY65456.1 hypothetical protein ASD39_15130 [Sphingomonas sp. Root50]KRB95246.1 hypothetical protein ASE22_04925 [Sphingomonas sp. Root720]
MNPDDVCRLMRRRGLLSSLKATRTIFAEAGDFVRATKVELGIQMLLDQRVSDRMLDLLAQSAAVAARDAADVAMAERD